MTAVAGRLFKFARMCLVVALDRVEMFCAFPLCHCRARWHSEATSNQLLPVVCVFLWLQQKLVAQCISCCCCWEQPPTTDAFVALCSAATGWCCATHLAMWESSMYNWNGLALTGLQCLNCRRVFQKAAHFQPPDRSSVFSLRQSLIFSRRRFVISAESICTTKQFVHAEMQMHGTFFVFAPFAKQSLQATSNHRTSNNATQCNAMTFELRKMQCHSQVVTHSTKRNQRFLINSVSVDTIFHLLMCCSVRMQLVNNQEVHDKHWDAIGGGQDKFIMVACFFHEKGARSAFSHWTLSKSYMREC